MSAIAQGVSMLRRWHRKMCESTVAVGQASRRGQDQLSCCCLVAAFGKLLEWVLEVTFFPHAGSLTLLLMRSPFTRPESGAVTGCCACPDLPATPLPPILSLCRVS